MNIAPDSMLDMLASRRKDLLCAVEFYESSYVPHVVHGFEPNNAIARYATETVSNYIFRSGVEVSYIRAVFSMPSLSRNIGKQSNSVTVRVSNVPKSSTPTIQPIASFVLNNDIEGLRMVIRLLTRAKLAIPGGTQSFVLFVGKCQRQDGFDRRDGTITAKQDLGQIEAVIPPRVFQKDCPLRFKGEECLGSEVLGDKSAAYQAATTCNKTDGQCFDYENLEFRQGIRVLQIPGSFIYKPHHGLLYKIIRYSSPIGYLGSKLFGKKPHAVGNSLEDGTPYGQTIPIVLGRWRMPGIPLQYQDVGETLNFLMAFCRGPIVAFHNIANTTPNFSQPVAVVQHLGEYGGVGTQTEDAQFPAGGFYSRLAYLTGKVTGSNVEVEDAAPDIVAMIAGVAANAPVAAPDSIAGEGTQDAAGVYNYISSQWNDNPVDLALFVLTDPALLNNPLGFIDQFRSAKTSIYCTGAIRDNTNAERLVLPNTETTKAGVDYKRYNTTGLIYGANPPSTGLPAAGAAHEVDYEYYDPNSPPTSVALRTFYRKRYTANIGLTEQKKAIDFVYDTLLPACRGFLSWDSHGRIGVRSERPSDSSLVRTASIVGATTIAIQDILPWALQWHETGVPKVGKILIGVGLATSEVRSVTNHAYSTAGNSITLAASSSGGTLTASGATFSGGSTSVAASASLTATGPFAQNNTVTATIDGEAITYTVGRNENALSVISALAFAINANPVVNKYVIAHCPTSGTAELFLYAKLGTLTVDAALEETHDIGEETIRVMMSFASSGLTYADCAYSNMLEGSFRYLGSDGQTRYNQFKGTFHDPLRDFAEQPVIINDYDHQDQIQKIQPIDIDLSAVDNYNQASRLLNGLAAKYGDGIDFFSWGSNGLALQLEEGDVVCLSHYAGEFRNQAVRIESLTVNDKFDISFKARVYSTSMFDDEVEETSVPLVSGLTNFAAPPPNISFNTVDFPPDGLTQTTDGSIGITTVRGGAIFGDSVYPQYAKVSVKRPGDTDFEQITIIYPDSNMEATFEFIASVDGLYTVQLEVCGTWGCNTTKPTASIIVGFGALTGIATEAGELLAQESALTDVILQE